MKNDFDYIKNYSNSGASIRIGEWDIPMPDMSPEKEMVNYELKSKNQFYKPLQFPKNWNYLSESEKDLVAENLLLRHRKNGRWMLINGNPYWIPPEADVYYSFFYSESGQIPMFRYEGLEYFWFLDWTWHHEDSFGVFDIKPRRIGDTDKTLAFGYLNAIKYRNFRFGMQNMKDDDALENYNRILYAHKRMPPIYKPKMPGKEDPVSGINFKYPGQHVSRKDMISDGYEDGMGEILELNSDISYRPTKLKEYDGQRLSFYHQDEPGKIVVMDVWEQWGIIKKCLSLNDEENIIGKAAYTTTIEDIKDGYTVEVMDKFWGDSSREEFEKNGRTSSGLFRLIRTAYDNAPIDEYGFPKKAEAKARLEKKIAEFERKGQLLEKTRYLRRAPRDIEDALKTPESDVDFDSGILDKQIDILKSRSSRAVRGNLYFENGTYYNENNTIADVKWRPDPNGRWYISQHPVRPNYMKPDPDTGMLIPGNKSLYACGIDTVETKKTEIRNKYASYQDKLSKQAIVVDRIFDPGIDCEPKIKFAGDEILNPEDLETGKTVCTYLYRHENPFQNFLDVLLTLKYFGIDALVERNKPYIKNKLEELGLHVFLQFRPRQSYPDWKTTKVSEVGIHANEMIVDTYITLIQQDIIELCAANEHLDLLQDLRKFNRDNRGKRDLSVAKGLTKIAALAKDVRMQRKYNREKAQEQQGEQAQEQQGFKKRQRINS